MSDTQKKLLYVLIFLSFFKPLWALTSLTHSCPEKFSGTVVDLSETQTPLFTHLKKTVVTFRVDDVDKGSVPSQVTLSFLPTGEVRLDLGDSVVVSMENGFLCGIELAGHSH